MAWSCCRGLGLSPSGLTGGGCSPLLMPGQHHLKIAGKILAELTQERKMLAAPTGSQVHLMLLLLLEADINFIISLYVIHFLF